MRLSTNVCDYCKKKCDCVGKITIAFKTVPEIYREGDICYNCAFELDKRILEQPDIKISPLPPKPATRGTSHPAEDVYMGGIGDH